MVDEREIEALAAELRHSDPQQVVTMALQKYGNQCTIAFSGSDDVAVIDLAARSGEPFSVVSVDTGRLHPETYELMDLIRLRYRLDIEFTAPQAEPLRNLVRKKGLFSFYEDGHHECCQIRKVEPLAKELLGKSAWMTGQRRDSSSARGDLEPVEIDNVFVGIDGPLVKFNPLVFWSRDQLWDYIKDNQLPYNALFDRGFLSIGCAPCTRPVEAGGDERSGRWWWEQNDSRECGLHVRYETEQGDPE